MQSVINQRHDQLRQASDAIDEDTFPHLPKWSKAIGLSTPAMDQVPPRPLNRRSSTNLKGYKRFGIFLRDLDPVKFTPTVDPPARTCYNCWNSNHLAYDCPEPLTDIFCCNCGRRYVKIEECPRCARVFWDLDESARQWLSSYIPGINQDDQNNRSKKDYNEYEDDENYKRKSFSDKSDSGKLKLKEDACRKEDLNKNESFSSMIQITNDNGENESDSDQWWDCCNSKDQSDEEQSKLVSKIDSNMIDNHSDTITNRKRFSPVLEVEKTKEDYHKSLLDDERNDHNNDYLQAANLNSDNIFEKHLNSFGESSSATSDQDEDYDNIIVDEEEQIEEECDVGNTVRDFLILLKAAKYLPFQQQNKIVFKFVSDCKKKL